MFLNVFWISWCWVHIWFHLGESSKVKQLLYPLIFFPKLTVLLRFGTSDDVFADLRWRLGWYQFNKSHKYGGASEWRALKTNSKILNYMRLFIGSQCTSRSCRTGVMCSGLGVLFITQAAAFCASCSRCIDFIGRPIHTLLQ